MKCSQLLRSEKGQMAIFLVLVFQVLFVLFAMVVNVGLVVHDKINLQNSTDLAAYYAAQRQAELLNQIAHINYQIRQAYKLMTFRLRVPGSVAIGIPFSALEKHPIFTPASEGNESTAFFDTPPGRRPPAVCTGSTLWYEYAITEGSDTVSLCKDLFGFATVPPGGGGGGPLGGLVSSLNNLLANVQAEISLKCRQIGVHNYVLATRFLLAYKLEADKRAKMIEQLTAQLAASGQSMNDFRGQSVYTGTLKTLQRNLTAPQKDTLQMTLLNSLSSDIPSQCSDPNFVFPKVEIFPVVNYVYMNFTGSNCDTQVKSSRDAANLPPAANFSLVPGSDSALLQQAFTDPNPVPMGVEKNPWCMPYMKVKASTSPRKIFAPFGTPVQLQAESYAKPFGGRIGPWYSKTWPSGSPTSVGLDRTDPLLPSRAIAGSPVGGPPELDIVNHSKYPGDQQGMNSKYALAIMNQLWQSMAGSNEASLTPAMAIDHYKHIGSPPEFEADADSLVRTNGSPLPADNMRKMEETAIAPDLFDITYYSIEARYADNYFNPTQPNFRSSISEFYPDLGSQNRNPYNVFNQMQTAQSVVPLNSVFYLADDPSQLLTGWTQKSVVNYEFPDDTFGRCGQRTDDVSPEFPAPGGCHVGGRSGYSVKIVSKNYLKTVSSDLGGPGNTGPILNPPAD